MTMISLSATYGNHEAARLSTAYEAVILTLSFGQCERMPDRATRLLIVQAMLAEARATGFDTERLKTAGLAAAQPIPGPLRPFKLYPWMVGAFSPAG